MSDNHWLFPTHHDSIFDNLPPLNDLDPQPMEYLDSLFAPQESEMPMPPTDAPLMTQQQSNLLNVNPQPPQEEQTSPLPHPVTSNQQQQRLPSITALQLPVPNSDDEEYQRELREQNQWHEQQRLSALQSLSQRRRGGGGEGSGRQVQPLKKPVPRPVSQQQTTDDFPALLSIHQKEYLQKSGLTFQRRSQKWKGRLHQIYVEAVQKVKDNGQKLSAYPITKQMYLIDPAFCAERGLHREQVSSHHQKEQGKGK